MSRGFDSQRVADIIVHALGTALLEGECYGTPAGRREAANLLRLCSGAFASLGPQVPAVLCETADAIDDGRLDPFELAEAWHGASGGTIP